jgi:hypothetical protein
MADKDREQTLDADQIGKALTKVHGLIRDGEDPTFVKPSRTSLNPLWRNSWLIDCKLLKLPDCLKDEKALLGEALEMQREALEKDDLKGILRILGGIETLLLDELNSIIKRLTDQLTPYADVLNEYNKICSSEVSQKKSRA